MENNERNNIYAVAFVGGILCIFSFLEIVKEGGSQSTATGRPKRKPPADLGPTGGQNQEG